MAVRPSLTIVGVGPGNPSLVTPQAVEAIRSAEIAVGWDLDFHPVRQWLRGKRLFLQDVRNYRRVVRQAVRLAHRTGQAVAVPRLGDPCISSGLKGLLEIFHNFNVSIVPGISSIQLAAALARINLDEAAIFSFHDYGDQTRRALELLEAFHRGRHLVVLSSPDLPPHRMAQFLIRGGVSRQTPAVICSSLTLPTERVVEEPLDQIRRRRFHWLTVSVVLNPAVLSEREDRQIWLRWRRRAERPQVKR